MREIRKSGSMRGCRKRAIIAARLRPTLQSLQVVKRLLPNAFLRCHIADGQPGCSTSFRGSRWKFVDRKLCDQIRAVAD